MDKPVHGRAVRTAGACAAGRSLVTRRAVAGRVLRCVRWTSVRGSCQRPVARVWAWADVQSAALRAPVIRVRLFVIAGFGSARLISTNLYSTVESLSSTLLRTRSLTEQPNP